MKIVVKNPDAKDRKARAYDENGKRIKRRRNVRPGTRAKNARKERLGK